ACYDESKRFGETLCVNYHKVHSIPVKIVRPFNNYGPGMRITDRRVMADFFRDALENRNIVLFSDGRATRTFCYTTDAITGYLQVLLSGHHAEPFNIGMETPEISMISLAKAVIQVTGRSLHVEYQSSEDADYIKDNPQRRCPDISKARTLVGYNPK